MERLAPGIWSWAARHPDWHPRSALGEAVRSYALRVGGGTVVVDPIAPQGDVDGLARALAPVIRGGRVWIHVTIPYHVRDAGPLATRLVASHAAVVHGHPALARRLAADVPFHAVAPGETLAHGVTALPIGNPRRYEMPLHVPGRAALVFGDAVVADSGALRVWIQRPIDDAARAWYADRFAPSLAPVLAAPVERVLVTHGDPVMGDGAAALQAAVAAGPWYHPPH
jgi:hypothetical protein